MGQLSLDNLKHTNRTFDNILDSKFNHVSDASTYAQVADTTHNNTTTAADVATLTIPAGRLNAGSLICVKSAGYVLDNNGSDTLTPVLKIGSTTLLTGAALDVADDDVLMLEAWIQIRTSGASGTLVAAGKLNTDGGGATTLVATTTSTAIDTTSAQAIVLNMDWSASHGDNEYTHLIHTAQVFG